MPPKMSKCPKLKSPPFDTVYILPRVGLHIGEVSLRKACNDRLFDSCCLVLSFPPLKKVRHALVTWSFKTT